MARARRPSSIQALARTSGPTALAHGSFEEDVREAGELLGEADSPNTVRAYQSDARDWLTYAKDCGLPAWPIAPAHLLAYIGAMEKRKLAVATIERRLAALARAHREKQLPSPTLHPKVQGAMKGLRNRHADTPRRKKNAITPQQLRKMVASVNLPTRALLLVGFCGGLRRSELVGLKWKQITFSKEGTLIRLGKSKTDQAGKGRFVPLARTGDKLFCPTGVLEELRAQHEGKETDRVFTISDRTVARRIKLAAKSLKENPAKYGGHSLRSGFVTTATRKGIAVNEIMAVTGHRSVQTVMGYARAREAEKNEASRGVADSLVDDE